MHPQYISEFLSTQISKVKPVTLATFISWQHIGGTSEVPFSLHIRLPL
jgi:hypothetical protein